jgi:hypothetical protein
MKRWNSQDFFEMGREKANLFPNRLGLCGETSVLLMRKFERYKIGTADGLVAFSHSFVESFLCGLIFRKRQCYNRTYWAFQGVGCGL